ncbi:hypothetical protein [Candidatus Methylacidithermus pantelleriae]|nr:hypothetical protein [Candidatus Methylacidithermus pantelleriae]
MDGIWLEIRLCRPETLPGGALTHYERLAVVEMGLSPAQKLPGSLYRVTLGAGDPSPQSHPDLFPGLEAHTAGL